MAVPPALRPCGSSYSIVIRKSFVTFMVGGYGDDGKVA